MAGSRECNAIARRIRPVLMDWPNVRRLDLAPAAAVEELQSRHGASRIVSRPPETPRPGVGA